MEYDITNITPESYLQMIQKLYKAGALSEKDYQELSAVRGDLEKAGIDPGESVNLLEFCSDKLKQDQKSRETPRTRPANSTRSGRAPADWMQKFAMIQANPEAVGLDVAG